MANQWTELKGRVIIYRRGGSVITMHKRRRRRGRGRGRRRGEEGGGRRGEEVV